MFATLGSAAHWKAPQLPCGCLVAAQKWGSKHFRAGFVLWWDPEWDTGLHLLLYLGVSKINSHV